MNKSKVRMARRENPPEPFLEMEFEEATKYVRGNLAATASSEDLLYFYSRYKQAKEGICKVPKPSFYQLSEKSKWSAWTDLGNMGQSEAMSEYVEKLCCMRSSWREEVVKDPTEGWVSVSSPMRAQESGDLTVWDLVKEGSLAELTGVLDTLQREVRTHLAESVELAELKDEEGLTLLHWAADRGQADMAELLLSRDLALLDARDGAGQTALHYAASCGHSQVVSLLLDRGADRSLQDEDGLTACNGDTEEEIKKLFVP